jgi:hypothetical protein
MAKVERTWSVFCLSLLISISPRSWMNITSPRASKLSPRSDSGCGIMGSVQPYV